MPLCSPRNKDKGAAAAAATATAAAANDDPAQDPALAPLLAVSERALRTCRPLWPDPLAAGGGSKSRSKSGSSSSSSSSSSPSPPKGGGGGGGGLALGDIAKDGGKALASTPSGIVRLPDGIVHISVVIPFPGVTTEMLEWWMAAFCEDSARYKLWHPTDHKWCGWADGYYETPATQRPPTHYLGKRWAVRETVGGQLKHYILHYLDPQRAYALPAPATLQSTAGIQAVLAARVYEPDALRGQMAVAHELNCLVTTGEGSQTRTELRCHFWLGDVAVPRDAAGRGWLPPSVVEGVGNHPWGRRAFAPLGLARAVHRHCFEEMSCLAAVLPEAYVRFKDAPYVPSPPTPSGL